MKISVDDLRNNASKACNLLASMANEKRLMILCQLVDGEQSVTALANLLDTRQSTVSQHLTLLRKDGFVESRRDAQTQYYSLAGKEVRTVIEALSSLYRRPRSRQRKRAVNGK